MPTSNYEILSLVVLGVLFGGMAYHLTLIFVAGRKNLHVAFVVAFLSMMFIIGFNNIYGALRPWWPGEYDYTKARYFLISAININLLSVNFIFAVLPRFRSVNRHIMYFLCTIALVVSVVYFFVDDAYCDAMIAVIAGVQFAYLSYVMYHLVKTININIIGSTTIPILFVLYIAFIIWTAVHALQNRFEIYSHFFVGAFFPVALSMIDALRRSFAIVKTRGTKSAVAHDVAQRMEELEVANTSKDKFFSIIAHDLKSPIGSIKTLSEIYIDEAAQKKDPHSTELAMALRDSIDGLCTLLDDLLSWSRSQIGAIKFLPSYIDIEALVNNIRRIVDPLRAAKNIELKVSIKNRSNLYGDPNMIQTVIRNLVTNAIKYSYSDSYIELVFDAEGFNSIIKVIDNGIGMNKTVLNDLFHIDKLSTRPGTNKETGNGLGLIVCQEFVKKHGGSIQVETEENLGTSFIIRLPYMRYNMNNS